MIPDATIRLIQDRLDIVDVIGVYVPLKGAGGKNLKACCPFHGEKTPSFTVSAEKQIFHCFGCGVGGNVFTFVMKIEKRDFRETVELLAERAGVEIPKDAAQASKDDHRRNYFIQAHAKASDFYHQFLLNKREASAARQYLEKRGLSQETVASFKIGYSPEAWDLFYSSVKGQAPDEVLEKSGLVIARKDGSGHYDRFRNRVMFPILDAKGICIGFGGRVMDDSVPKYLNSPETEIYSKGRHLYGLYQARKAIRDLDQAVVVEGYMDVISCHQAGVTSVVASLGTALTPEQVRLLKRHTKNVCMLYDADKAGENATLRGLEILLEEGMEVKIVRLPQGEDPDSFVRQHGAARMNEEIAGARSLFEYKLALLKNQHDAKTLEGKVRIANDLVGLFGKVHNEILRSAWIRALAQELALSEAALLAEMKKGQAQTPTRSGRPTLPPQEVASPRRESFESVSAVERMMIGLLLENETFSKRVRETVDEEDFQHPVTKKIIRKVLEEAKPYISPNELVNVFAGEPAVGEFISRAASEIEALSEKTKVLSDCIVQMKRRRIRVEREELMSHIATAERVGDRNRINEFMSCLHELNKREKQINEKK